MPIKTIVIIILIVVHLYRTLLRIIDWRSEKNPIPANVSDVYDAETYRKWRAYHGEKCRLGMLSGAAGFAIELALMAGNLYAAFARLFPQGLFTQMFAVLLLSALAELPLLPFEWIDTMVIEEKYGFNRSSKGTFWMDRLKQFAIGLLIMTVVGSVLMGAHRWLGDWMIVAFAAVMMLLVLGISFLFPLLSRVFNKFTPLEAGELRDRLTGLLERHGYRVRAIQVMDASRRSTKSNAYFTGFGRMKTIVLYDTLVQSNTPEEICAVFAHELGHGLHRDTLKMQILNLMQMAALGVLAWLTLRGGALFTPFGFEGVNYGFALILIMSVEYALIAPLFGLIANAVSRRAEYRADAQAVREGYGEALVSALRRLSRQNFADLAPSPLLVKLEYAHPTLSQRIDAIEGRGRR